MARSRFGRHWMRVGKPLRCRSADLWKTLCFQRQVDNGRLFKKGEISKAITSGTVLVSGVGFLVTVALYADEVHK